MLGLPARPWGPQSGGTSIGYEACLVAGYVWCLTEMISGGPTVIFGMLLRNSAWTVEVLASRGTRRPTNSKMTLSDTALVDVRILQHRAS
mmetsp:Transcript_20317/g.47167  ORF Transcript_20317/g.47167 Transcript_20317/m.47167 type:complete len:90 (-) Transcript_20317:77-346(-)